MVHKNAYGTTNPDDSVVPELDSFDTSLKSDTAQQIIQQWIEEATGRVFNSSRFIESLQDGVLLCYLVKRIQPDSEIIQDVIEAPNPQESQINLKKFLAVCSELGLSGWQLFDPNDLEVGGDVINYKSEDEVIQKVVSTLYWLGCTVQGMSYYRGPRLNLSNFQRESDGTITVKPNARRGNDYSYARMDGPHINGGIPHGDAVPMHLTNGYAENMMTNGDEAVEFSVNVRILGDEKRFGFSVMGGTDEGFPPRIDEISPESPAAKTGLLVDDEILEVNGESVANLSHTEVILSIHKCLRNRVIALKVRRGRRYFQGVNGIGNHDDVNANHTGKVDMNTRNKIQKIMQDHESDPQFQCYNSDAESEGSNNDQEFYGNGDVGVVSPGPGWSKDYGNKNFGISGKNVAQSNLQKHKSLSTPLFDLTKLDTIETEVDVDENDAYALRNEAYDSDLDEDVLPGEAEKELLFPCMNEVKSKLQSSSDMDDIAFVENLFEQKDFQDATNVYTKMVELERSGRGLSSVSPVATNSQHLSSQLRHSLEAVRDSRDAEELLEILQSPNFQSLLLAHDRLAFREALPSEEDEQEMESEPEQHQEDQQVTDGFSLVEDDNVKIVRIDKATDPLGATVKNENGTVMIGRIVKGGAADKCGLLQEGDEILEINGVNMRGKTVAEVCELLADMNGTLTFVLNPANRSRVPSDREVHVRAHFDYHPYEDDLIPCRELGLAFRRGDILHVVNQEDPNWWQAWRAGEEGKTLAGLIPSKHFQQQKESMKKTTQEAEQPNREKRGCLCFRRKRRRKVLYNAQRNEEYVADEVLTYEEVALLQPDPQRKRPVVLIGPDKVGRKELRQRLILYSQERFAGVVPHTSRPKRPEEVHERDYYFVPLPSFEADIISHKFVEYGEFEGHYYGTALDSIRRVVNSGKYCILNLHCEALKVLKASDVKPYVVFISPASYDRILTLRRGKVDPFNPKPTGQMTDAELRDMVDKGREMEETYGHYFEKTIVNTDLERTFDELRQVIDKLDVEAQWVPASWVNESRGGL
ncbi:Maguk P55 subfamily member [Porites harrisoni]